MLKTPVTCNNITGKCTPAVYEAPWGSAAANRVHGADGTQFAPTLREVCG